MLHIVKYNKVALYTRVFITKLETMDNTTTELDEENFERQRNGSTMNMFAYYKVSSYLLSVCELLYGEFIV